MKSGPIAIAATAAALLLASVATGAAAVLTLSGGTLTTLPANYTTEAGAPGPFNATTPVRQFVSADAAGGGLHLSANSAVRFTYLGEAAGYNNFALGNAVLFSNNGSTAGETVTENQIGPGYLNFRFRADNDPARDAHNNGPISAGLTLAFLLESATSAVAFFDDGGAGPDFDLNDMVVRIEVVPLPASGLLLIGALGGAGIAARRRRSAAAGL